MVMIREEERLTARRPRAAGLAVSCLLALVCATSCSTTPPPFAEAPDDPAGESLRASVEHVAAGFWNPGRLGRARERAEALGVASLGEDEWIDWFTIQRNHVITIPGRGPGIAYVVAHYDKADGNPFKVASALVNGAIDELVGWTYLSQGAWDNATGVAVALELARAISEMEPNLTWRVLLAGAEESGLRGARAHVARLSREEWAELRFAINVDTVGKDDRANCVLSDASDSGLVAKTLDLSQASGIPLELGRMPLSASGDHVVFGRTSFWHDFGRGLLFNLAGGFLPQRSWFTGSHGTRVVAFVSCDALDWSDFVSSNLYLPLGRLHGPRDRASRIDPTRLHDQYRLLLELVKALDADPPPALSATDAEQDAP